MLWPLLADRPQQEVAASSPLGERGDTSEQDLAKEAAAGTQVLGAVTAPSDGALAWHEQQAICRQGQSERWWQPGQDGQRAVSTRQVAVATCPECPVRQDGGPTGLGDAAGRLSPSLPSRQANSACVSKPVQPISPR